LANSLAEQQKIGIYAAAASAQPGTSAPFALATLWGITDTASWDVTDELKIKNIAAYRSTTLASAQDPSATAFPIWTQALPGNLSAPPSDQATEELQLQGDSLSDKLQWVVGGFLLFQHNANQESNWIETYSFGATHLGTANPGSRSQAVFTQGTYDLGDFVEGLKFTAGYRYTWDDVWNTLTNYNLKATGPVCIYSPAPPNCTLSANKNFHSPSWNVDMDYQLTPDTLVYVSARRGYKGGGLNPQTPLASTLGFGPEDLTDVEIGVKSDWQVEGIKVRTNLDAYSDDYTRIQLPTTITGTNGTVGQVTLNAGTATIQGVEFDGTVVPFKDMEIKAVYSYGHGHYDSFISSIPLGSIAYAGLPLHQFSITGSYRIPLPEDIGDVRFSTTLSYRSHEVLGTTPDPFNYQSGYGTLNARIDWTNILGHPLDAGLFVTNATDYAAKYFGWVTYASIGFSSTQITEPRMFGVQLKYRFGPRLDL
jgi:iron complex outermembrane receptor protein